MGEDLVLSISPCPPRAWDEAIKSFPNQMLGLQNQPTLCLASTLSVHWCCFSGGNAGCGAGAYLNIKAV